jgi:hypothetical protein
MLLGASGSLGGNSAEWGRAALGHHDGIDAGSVSGAEERAEILRILNAVEGQNQPWSASGFEDIFYG